RWTKTGRMNEARRWHTLTLLDDGQVLAVGGSRGADEPVRDAELYQPATGVWTPTGALHVGRQSHTATRLADGTVLVVGGYGRAPDFRRLVSAEVYSPTDETWTRTANLHDGRGGHTATRLADGRVLVAGGDGGDGTLAS